ncbi:MAG: hypothetical protein J5976_06050 [Bacteroidales bacterium]|nr:hypothetical protein [Bacteroidales bacterium]
MTDIRHSTTGIQPQHTTTYQSIFYTSTGVALGVHVDVYCADNEEDKSSERRMFIGELFVGVSRRGNCGEGGILWWREEIKKPVGKVEPSPPDI